MAEDLCPEEMITQVTPAVSVLSESGGGGGARGPGSAELGRRLLLAARHGDTALVLDLMARGAPFTTDWLGTSALHAAASGAHADTCAVLLRAGVSRDCRTKVDRTPLHMAAHAGHAEVAELLLEHHACVDCRDMLHMTPLHWAAARGHVAAAAALLRHGADPAALSKFNKTPRALAAARRHHHLVRLMDVALREREPPETEDSTTIEQQRTAEVTERVSAPPAAAPAAAPAPSEPPRPEPITIHLERPLAEGGGGGGAALLRQHGISPLPHDPGSTVLTALQSGRSVVLSDAGKLMLKESVAAPPSSAPAPAPAAPATRPVRVFALNKSQEARPARRVLNSRDMQIKFLQMPSDKKVPITKSIELKAKTKLVRSPPAAAAPASPVKIMMKKANLSKLLSPTNEDNGLDAAAEKCNQNVVFVPEAFLTNDSPAYLRSQLLAAHRTIASLHAQLARCRARLARHEAP